MFATPRIAALALTIVLGSTALVAQGTATAIEPALEPIAPVVAASTTHATPIPEPAALGPLLGAAIVALRRRRLA